MKSRNVLCLLLLCLPVAASFSADDVANDLILVLDGSNSMWGQIEGENKIVIARRSVGELIDRLPDGSDVGLVAYGHRVEGDCDDIETLQGLEPLQRDALKAAVDSVTPTGRTPISASLETAFGLLDPESAASVILVSDGLETCSRDPCETVRAAKASGLPFVLHVVGFDVGGEDTTQLECAAQAGGGVFLPASDAEQLSDALAAAYEKPTTPDGRLSVTVTANGGLQDARVEVFDATTNQPIAGGRTYVSAQTNPRQLALEDGSYRASVTAVGIGGSQGFDFDFDIVDGGSVERTFDFSSGEVSVRVTRNGELSDATVRVLTVGEQKQVGAGRTYVAASSNPRVLTVPAGTYDVVISSVELKGESTHRIDRVVVAGGERTELAHDYVSGDLSVEVRRGEALIDAVVQIYDEADRSVVGRRAYANGSNNPVTFELAPGRYRLRVSEVRGDRTETVSDVAAQETTAVIVDLDNPAAGSSGN
ncbi:MAG: VWA domain-containing protein [Pseudomonadota bacterium]